MPRSIGKQSGESGESFPKNTTVKHVHRTLETLLYSYMLFDGIKLNTMHCSLYLKPAPVIFVDCCSFDLQIFLVLVCAN